jgi:dUTP pyrophosphatase
MKIYYSGDLIPKRGSDEAAGWDVIANEDVRLPTMVPTPVSTGLFVEIPKGYYLAVVPRSGLSLKGVTVYNAPGTVDCDFRGEIKIILLSLGQYEVKKGDKIAQLILSKYYIQEYAKKRLSKTKRGTNGFGSTGV